MVDLDSFLEINIIILISKKIKLLSYCFHMICCLFSSYQEMSKYSSECPPEIMDSEDYLFLLYTSGSTGKPKGVAHSIAGYLLYANLTHKVSHLWWVLKWSFHTVKREFISIFYTSCFEYFYTLLVLWTPFPLYNTGISYYMFYYFWIFQST